MKSLKYVLAATFALAPAFPVFADNGQPDEEVAPIREVFEPSAPRDPESQIKVAVVQWNPGPAPVGPGATRARVEAFMQGNREALAAYIREAVDNGAQMVITPEFAMVGYPDFPELPPEDDEFRNREDIAPFVEPVDGPTTRYFSTLARELGIYLHVGFAEVDGRKFYNTVVALSPQGQVLAHYRKINLYNNDTGGEGNFLSPGRDTATYESPAGKVGLIICADVYSSNPMSKYQRQGVKVYALSTSWNQMNTGMDYFKRAARDARAFLLAANMGYFPDSGVVNPSGTTQSHVRQSGSGVVAYGYLPKETGQRTLRR